MELDLVLTGCAYRVQRSLRQRVVIAICGGNDAWRVYVRLYVDTDPSCLFGAAGTIYILAGGQRYTGARTAWDSVYSDPLCTRIGLTGHPR